MNAALNITHYCEEWAFSGLITCSMRIADFTFDPHAWANESFEAGIEIYKTVEHMGNLTEDQIHHIQDVLKKQMCRAGKRLALTFELIYSDFPPPPDFYIIMMVFVCLLGVVVIDEIYHGGSCSKQRFNRMRWVICRREYVGIDSNRKKVKFDFGNSKI